MKAGKLFVVASGPRAAFDMAEPYLTALGRGVTYRRCAVLHRVTAGGVALVHRAPGVGCNEFDAVERHIEFFRRHLDQRGLDALSEFGLSGEHGDASLRIDLDPGVEIRVDRQASG